MGKRLIVIYNNLLLTDKRWTLNTCKVDNFLYLQSNSDLIFKKIYKKNYIYNLKKQFVNKILQVKFSFGVG